jgi:electron transport complex protein RnfE
MNENHTIKPSFGGIFRNGVLDENPIFRLVLGMCPTLAVTTTATNGLGMGIATTFVLTMSNLFISLLRRLIPDNVRIPAFVVVIATFTTIVQLLLKAFVPVLDKSLGLFIPLIVVNCIVFARAESFAFKNGPAASIVDGLGCGLGFTLALILLAGVRELFGAGTLFGWALMPEGYLPMGILTQPPGAYMILGLLLILFNTVTSRMRKAGGEAK